MPSSPAPAPSRTLALWLYTCAFMVFAMIIIGAITRLTESGLSITEWKPITGILPPLSAESWAAEFEKYRQSPEFIKKNGWMQIEDFKAIFFWEWLHRFWGRMIGLVFALPLAYFWLTRQIPSGYKPRLLAMLVLGGMQGVMGWYMVMSGLVDIPAVSHFRLAAHLLLALLIIVCLLWLGFSLSGKARTPSKSLFVHGLAVLALVSLTIFWGALTAGLDAGLIYNESFPKMGGQWIPPDFWAKGDLIQNILHNHSAVQFTHRWLAVTTVCAALSLWAHGALRQHPGFTTTAIGIIALLQAGLGIATLLSGVHLHIAVTHQAGAVILLSAVALHLYQTKAAVLSSAKTQMSS